MGRRYDDASRSLKRRNLDYLMSEAVDRASFEAARQSIEPLSDIEDLPAISKMSNTKAALRGTIDKLEEAISSEPDPILSAIGLDRSQRKLVDAITAAEVLKFTILNAMDAVRLLIINDFKTELKFFTDEAIVFDLIKLRGGGAKLRSPRRVPFSEISALGDFDRYHEGRKFMVIGKASADEGFDVMLSAPGVSSTLPLENVSADKIYVVGRGDDGEPKPAPGGVKELFLKVSAPSRAKLDSTLASLAASKGFDIDSVVGRNFKISSPAEGFIVSIYRKFRGTPAIKPTSLTASQFSDDLKLLSLDEFKKVFEMMAQKTTDTSTNLVTFDPAEALVFGGLASIGASLGISRPTPAAVAGGGAAAAGASAAAAAGAGAGAAAAGVAAAGGAGAAGGGSAIVRRHSLSNILGRPSITAGSSDSERKTNLRVINQDELRKELNSLVGGSVIFTESAVDRWCKLAGIKESK
jgi:hypothetical protein